MLLAFKLLNKNENKKSVYFNRLLLSKL